MNVTTSYAAERPIWWRRHRSAALPRRRWIVQVQAGHCRAHHEVAVVAPPPGEPGREPVGVAFVERAEGAHVAFGCGEKQRLVARAAVHVLTVASPGRKIGSDSNLGDDNEVHGPATQSGEQQTETNRALASAGRGCPADRGY
jgi:hypothetical protein